MAEKKFGSSKKIALIIEAVEANGLPSKDVAIETATNDINNVRTTNKRRPRHHEILCSQSS